jgi:uncharacterized membrane protein YphA (DoxX/SURF4 family)
MSKRNKIIYWIATIWLSLGMVSTGLVQLMQIKEETQFIINLGYPKYILPFLGISKILGTVVILIPKFPLLKEWAYAGFVFTIVGAIYSHSMVSNSISEFAPAMLLLALSIISYLLRPSERKLV